MINTTPFPFHSDKYNTIFLFSLYCLRCILARFLLHAPLVGGFILHEQRVGIRLRGTVGIGFIQQILNPHEYLLDGDGRTPSLLFIQNGKADSSRGVDVGMEEGRDEFA